MKRICCYMLLFSLIVTLSACEKKDSDPDDTNTFNDSRDGHTYETVKIGNQIWMAENLSYLPSVSPSSTGSDTEPYYYVYGYEGISVTEAKASENYKTYGVLYNWEASLEACPEGWHLPAHDEWTELENYLIANGYNYDGTTSENKIAKALATKTNWVSSTGTGAVGNADYPEMRNKTGFSGLPGGNRGWNGVASNMGYYGNWWSTRELSSTNAWGPYLRYNFDALGKYEFVKKENGFSVRCLKD